MEAKNKMTVLQEWKMLRAGGRVLRIFRKGEGWTRAKLAEKIGLSAAKVAAVEMGLFLPRQRDRVKVYMCTMGCAPREREKQDESEK